MPATIIQIIEVSIKYAKENFLINWSLIDIARMLRNSFLILVNGYSVLIPLLLSIIFIWLIKNKKWQESVLFFSFFIPFFLTAKFWYGGLYGRYSSFAGYGLALMIALTPRKLYWTMIASILIVFIPALAVYQHIPYPHIQKQILDKSRFHQNDLLILSDYQRPQLTYANALYINGNMAELKIIEEKIAEALKNKKRVLISQQAITFPYYQYDGQQIHIISYGDKNKALLKKFLKDKKLSVVSTSRYYPLLAVYQIGL